METNQNKVQPEPRQTGDSKSVNAESASRPNNAGQSQNLSLVSLRTREIVLVELTGLQNIHGEPINLGLRGGNVLQLHLESKVKQANAKPK